MYHLSTTGALFEDFNIAGLRFSNSYQNYWLCKPQALTDKVYDTLVQGYFIKKTGYEALKNQIDLIISIGNSEYNQVKLDSLKSLAVLNYKWPYKRKKNWKK